VGFILAGGGRVVIDWVGWCVKTHPTGLALITAERDGYYGGSCAGDIGGGFGYTGARRELLPS